MVGGKGEGEGIKGGRREKEGREKMEKGEKEKGVEKGERGREKGERHNPVLPAMMIDTQKTSSLPCRHKHFTPLYYLKLSARVLIRSAYYQVWYCCASGSCRTS